MSSLDTFERAFSGNTGSCRGRCDCGVVFFDCGNDGYSWEPGELEALEADPAAKDLPYAVTYVVFEGRYYVSDCSCWHERAEQVKKFIDGHAAAIAEYIRLEKARKQRDAEMSPTVD